MLLLASLRSTLQVLSGAAGGEQVEEAVAPIEFVLECSLCSIGHITICTFAFKDALEEVYQRRRDDAEER